MYNPFHMKGYSIMPIVDKKQKIILKENYPYDKKDCNRLVSSRPKIIR